GCAKPRPPAIRSGGDGGGRGGGGPGGRIADDLPQPTPRLQSAAGANGRGRWAGGRGPVGRGQFAGGRLGRGVGVRDPRRRDRAADPAAEATSSV
ncbi:MAG: hypothetical protein AVDCRST_MAG73-1162, partial [uncultured Thermomicrobiales bacterium]